MSKLLKQFLMAIGVVVFLFVGSCVGIKIALDRALDPKISPKYYPGVVQKLQERSDFFGFLPPQLDPDAERTSFYYLPGFLQGGTVVCVRQKLPPEKIEQMLNELETSGRAEVDRLGQYGYNVYPSYDLPKPNGHQNFQGVGELPPGFRIFLYKSSPERIKESPNHNRLGFTAVSPELSEVVYHANSW